MARYSKKLDASAIGPEPAPEQSTQGGQAFIKGGQTLKPNAKAAVFKRESLLNERPNMSIGGAWPPCPP